MNQTLIEQIGIYVTERVPDYELRVQLALSIIGRDRTSLQHADRSLYNEMYDAVEEFINDHGLSVSPDDIDLEDLMFNF